MLVVLPLSVERVLSGKNFAGSERTLPTIVMEKGVFVLRNLAALKQYRPTILKQ
jgi:hypothetical protein